MEEQIEYFKVAKDEIAASENWYICFGYDYDADSDWYITTNNIHASELHFLTGGAKADAELVCRLLNEHYNKLYRSDPYDTIVLDENSENAIHRCAVCGNLLEQIRPGVWQCNYHEDCEDISSMTPEERLAAIMAMGGTWSDFGEDSEQEE